MSSTIACTSTVTNTETNLPAMIVPCRVGVVNRRGMVPSRSSVRIVRATLAAPKNMKKIIMPARIWPVTLTSFSVLPACGERWLICRPAETPPAWLNSLGGACAATCAAGGVAGGPSAARRRRRRPRGRR